MAYEKVPGERYGWSEGISKEEKETEKLELDGIFEELGNYIDGPDYQKAIKEIRRNNTLTFKELNRSFGCNA